MTTVKQYTDRLEKHIIRIESAIKNGDISERDLICSAGIINWKDEGWTPYTSIKKTSGSTFKI